MLRHELAGPAVARLEDLEVEQDGDERVGLVERAVHGGDHELAGSEAGVSLKAAREEVTEGRQRAGAQRLEGGQIGGGEPAVHNRVERHAHVVGHHDPLSVGGHDSVHKAKREQQPLYGTGALRGALCKSAGLVAEAAVRDGMGRLSGPEEQGLRCGRELLKEGFEVICVVEPLNDAEDEGEGVVFVGRLRLDLMEGGEFCEGLVVHPRQKDAGIGPVQVLVFAVGHAEFDGDEGTGDLRDEDKAALAELLHRRVAVPHLGLDSAVWLFKIELFGVVVVPICKREVGHAIGERCEELGGG